MDWLRRRSWVLGGGDLDQGSKEPKDHLEGHIQGVGDKGDYRKEKGNLHQIWF